MFQHVSASRLRNVFCLNLAFLAYRKNYISGYIWPSSFIQTVKCSLLDKKIVYRSFYGAPLTFSSFLLQGKVLFRTRRQVALASVVTKTWNQPKPPTTNQYDSMRPEKTLCLWFCVMLRDYIALDIARQTKCDSVDCLCIFLVDMKWFLV